MSANKTNQPRPSKGVPVSLEAVNPCCDDLTDLIGSSDCIYPADTVNSGFPASITTSGQFNEADGLASNYLKYGNYWAFSYPASPTYRDCCDLRFIDHILPIRSRCVPDGEGTSSGPQDQRV